MPRLRNRAGSTVNVDDVTAARLAEDTAEWELVDDETPAELAAPETPAEDGDESPEADPAAITEPEPAKRRRTRNQ